MPNYKLQNEIGLFKTRSPYLYRDFVLSDTDTDTDTYVINKSEIAHSYLSRNPPWRIITI